MFLLLACTVPSTPSEAAPSIASTTFELSERVLIEPSVRTHVVDGSGASPLAVCSGGARSAQIIDGSMVALMDCRYDDGSSMTLFVDAVVSGTTVEGTVTMTRDGEDHVTPLDSRWEDGLELTFDGTWAARPGRELDYEGRLRVR